MADSYFRDVRVREAQVFGPTMPSGLSPCLRWKRITAVLVAAP
jgi:hypothetical protein